MLAIILANACAFCEYIFVNPKCAYFISIAEPDLGGALLKTKSTGQCLGQVCLVSLEGVQPDPKPEVEHLYGECECATNAASVWRPALKTDPTRTWTESSESAATDRSESSSSSLPACRTIPSRPFTNDSHSWKAIVWQLQNSLKTNLSQPRPHCRPVVGYDL